MEVASYRWEWTSGLARFPGQGILHLCSGGWSWIFSVCSVMKCPVVGFGVSMGLLWLWTACLLMLKAVFLLYCRISVVCFALELVGS